MNKWLEAAKPVRETMDIAGAMLTDEQAAAVPALYQEWENDSAYAVGDRRTYKCKLYRCLVAHTAQTAWNPEDAHSIWTLVLIPDPTVIPEWVQPDSTNAYKLGDKVTHKGKTWECTGVDGGGNNTWEPGVYGWEEVL